MRAEEGGILQNVFSKHSVTPLIPHCCPLLSWDIRLEVTEEKKKRKTYQVDWAEYWAQWNTVPGRALARGGQWAQHYYSVEQNAVFSLREKERDATTNVKVENDSKLCNKSFRNSLLHQSNKRTSKNGHNKLFSELW